jgi:hypothetical protein
VTYYNCGDWVESCSALVEESDGIISLINYDPFAKVCHPDPAVAGEGTPGVLAR